MLLLTIVLYICIDIKSIVDNQSLNLNDEKENRVELGDALFQKILKDQKVTYNRTLILIFIVLLYILCCTINNCFNILHIIIGYFVCIDNIIEYIINNLNCIEFLIIYKIV